MIKKLPRFCNIFASKCSRQQDAYAHGAGRSQRRLKKWVAILLIPALLLSSLDIVLTEPAPVLAAPAAITQNLYYDLASDTLSDWSSSGAGIRTGIRLQSTGNTLTFSRSDLALDDKAFQIEVVVSAQALEVDGERGARFWAQFGNSTTLPPGEVYQVEVRLVRSAGLVRVELFDTASGFVTASLNADWTNTDIRMRVRLKRQRVAGLDYLLLQAEPSSVWDDPLQPNNLNVAHSQAVLLPSFLSGPGSSEVGFGNVLAGVYYSEWESVHLTTAADLTTVLPYWPPKPTAPTLAHVNTEAGNPQGVNFSDNLAALYLANDAATPALDANGTTLFGATRTNLGNELWYFAGINDNQTVHGRVKVSDVSGRSRTSDDSSLLIQTGPINTPIPAIVDIDPNTLNLKSQSDKNAFTAYIELPTGYDVGQISVSTVRLIINGVTIFAQTTPTSVGDYDRDKVPDRMVKFAWQAVITALGGQTGDISMTVTGQLNDDRVFTGSDTIKVINPGK